jgi:maltose O-acetyltransferase
MRKESARIIKALNPRMWIHYFERKSIRKKIGKCGENFSFGPYCTFVAPQLLKIGHNVFIGEKAHISGEITIGNNVIFGPSVIILDGNHLYAVFGKSVRFLRPDDRNKRKATIIEDEVWCGAGVIILGGTVVGMGSVVGAGSVVSRDVPPYVVAVGNRCHPIKKIFSDEVLANHLRKLGMDEEKANAIVCQRLDALKQTGMESIPIIDRSERCEAV